MGASFDIYIYSIEYGKKSSYFTYYFTYSVNDILKKQNFLLKM